MIQLARQNRIVRNAYNTKWRRNLWQALNAEKIIFGSGGRDAFANYMYDTINDGMRLTNVIEIGGENYDPENSFPSSKTINNFLNSGLATTEANLPGNLRTLRAIHIFLWLKKPEIVEHWFKDAEFLDYTNFVEGINESYKFLRPSDVLPRGVRLFQRVEDKTANVRDIRKISSDYNKLEELSEVENIKFMQKEYPEEGNGILFMGILILLMGEGVEGKAIIYSSKQWRGFENVYLKSNLFEIKDENFNFLYNATPNGSIFF